MPEFSQEVTQVAIIKPFVNPGAVLRMGPCHTLLARSFPGAIRAPELRSQHDKWLRVQSNNKKKKNLWLSVDVSSLRNL